MIAGHKTLMALALAVTLPGCKDKTPDPSGGPPAKASEPSKESKEKVKATPKISASPGVVVHGADTPPPGVDPKIFQQTVRGLDQLRSCPEDTKIAMMRLTQCAEWKTLIKGASMDIGGWQRSEDKELGRKALRTRADAAVVRLEADHEMVRLGARRILELALRTLQHEETEENMRYRNAMGGRLKHSDDPTERQAIIAVMANYPAPAVTDALIHVLDNAPQASLRSAAANAITRCVPNRCTLEPPDKVEAWYGKERDPGVRNALIHLAGALKRPAVTTWCEDQLLTGPLSVGCRRALQRLGDNSSADALLRASTKAFEAPPADADAAHQLATRLADLTRFHDRPPIKKAWAGLVATAVKQLKAYPSALQLIAEQQGLIADQSQGLKLALEHYNALRKEWKGDKLSNEQAGALQRFRQVIERLGGGDQLDEFEAPPPLTGPDGKPLMPQGNGLPGMMPPGMMPPGAMPPGAMPPGSGGKGLPFPSPHNAVPPKPRGQQPPAGALPFPAPSSP